MKNTKNLEKKTILKYKAHLYSDFPARKSHRIYAWLPRETDFCYEGKVYLCVSESLPLLPPFCMQIPQDWRSGIHHFPGVRLSKIMYSFSASVFLPVKWAS